MAGHHAGAVLLAGTHTHMLGMWSLWVAALPRAALALSAAAGPAWGLQGPSCSRGRSGKDECGSVRGGCSRGRSEKDECASMSVSGCLMLRMDI